MEWKLENSVLSNKNNENYHFSGKNAKTGKIYAFKQERPANHWEFYISLEIASRIEDPKMVKIFCSFVKRI